MIYPKSFETKIGFDGVRQLLHEHCLSTLGKQMVDEMAPTSKHADVDEWLNQVREFRLIQQKADDFPLLYFFDLRKSISRLRIDGTHLDEQELFDLKRSLETITAIVSFLNRTESGADGGSDGIKDYAYPTLHKLALGVMTFPEIIRDIDRVLDKYGKIKDNASPHLLEIRRELAKAEGSVSRTLNAILKVAQKEGFVDKDAAPTMRDGRLVLPVAPALKRKIKGIVHDESATGRTVFIEPAEVVEANNRIRELEADERREIVKILTDLAKSMRPHADDMAHSYTLLANIDFIRAKAEMANAIGAIEPEVMPKPYIDWIHAVHPLLDISLRKQGKKVVPLDIMLVPDKRLLIISGPNAGGKSVCLKTVGLLQYMLQCGLPVPLGDRSKAGIFRNIMIDIGDEQSIENDLSTYSSHLLNMKMMMRYADKSTLILIDEFGTGTEPQIGGAIAESVLTQLWNHKAWGVITTHYQNLKHFADNHKGVANGAMLYDRHEMRPLFQLEIGRPGSSFAIEIARKIGLPEDVIAMASDIVGSDYIQSDKYLQDIVRDKRYWEGKRQTIHQQEKNLEQTIAQYEEEIAKLHESRRQILDKARQQAEEMLAESNRRIENTIKEIRESQAEKEHTRKLREQLSDFKQDVQESDDSSADELVSKKIKQIQERKQRKEKRRREKQNAAPPKNAAATAAEKDKDQIAVGDNVRIKGLTAVGQVESIQGTMATVVFGGMRTKMRAERLEHAQPPQKTEAPAYASVGRQTREAIDKRKLNFKQDLDVRGMRGDEAITAVTYFIDDAILLGMSRVRILHGTGSGILRQLIRQYLATVLPVKNYRDEHVQFGGAGITVVDLE